MQSSTRTAAVLLCLASGLVLAGCTAAPTEVQQPTLVDLPAIAPQDDLGGFAVPMWLDVPRDLVRERTQKRMVGWTLAGSADDGIRLMAPVIVRPDGAAPRAAPIDYGAYLLSMRSHGARVTERLPTAVAGVHARRFSITANRAVDAGLGCWAARPDDCFALTPGVSLDLVVFAAHGRPLVLWSRTWKRTPDPLLRRSLDRLVDSITFVDERAR